MQLVDTHCHIHDPKYELQINEVLNNANNTGVEAMICIGTSALDSQQAVDFVRDRPNCFASVGLHPHDARFGEDDFEVLACLASNPKVVAIGEFGIDYYYENSHKDDQAKALRYQFELAVSTGKPCIFHVRDSMEQDKSTPHQAFSDFWAVFDEFTGIRGVVHSFSSGEKQLEECLRRGLYIGLNGIVTFTKNQDQLDAVKSVPLERLLLETDAPFLTPVPKRGTINEPANVGLVAEFLSRLRGESIETLAEATTGNAVTLFGNITK